MAELPLARHKTSILFARKNAFLIILLHESLPAQSPLTFGFKQLSLLVAVCSSQPSLWPASQVTIVAFSLCFLINSLESSPACFLRACLPAVEFEAGKSIRNCPFSFPRGFVQEYPGWLFSWKAFLVLFWGGNFVCLQGFTIGFVLMFRQRCVFSVFGNVFLHPEHPSSGLSTESFYNYRL